MTRKYCDICGCGITPQITVKLGGAIQTLSGADEVCRSCAAKINETDWRRVVRSVVTGEAVGTPCDACVWSPPSSGDGKPCEVCPATGS